MAVNMLYVQVKLVCGEFAIILVLVDLVASLTPISLQARVYKNMFPLYISLQKDYLSFLSRPMLILSMVA